MLQDILQLILVLILVGLNGFFVAAEFALLSVRSTRIEELVAKGNTRAIVVRQAIKNTDRFIAATQLGITIASLGLGWVGEPALERFISPLVELLPEQIAGAASHSISAVISFTIITSLHVVVGELAPKSIALQYPEETSMAVARPTLFLAFIFTPFIWVLNGAGNGLLRLVGINPATGHDQVHSVEELRMIVEASAEGGALDASQQQMVEAVFDFRKLLARQVLVPRTELTMLQADQTLHDLIALGEDDRFSRYPVYGESPDSVVGILYTRDCIELLAEGKLDTKLRELVRPVIFIPETTPVTNLLSLLREKRQHIAIVIDEFGGTEGLVTLEDILEEIVGTLPDEDEHELARIVTMSNNSTLVSGLTLIEDVNEHFDLSLEDSNYDTIAGFVMGQLDRIPQVGDEVKIDSTLFRVVTMDGKRIARLMVPPLAAKKDASMPSPDSEH